MHPSQGPPTPCCDASLSGRELLLRSLDLPSDPLRPRFGQPGCPPDARWQVALDAARHRTGPPDGRRDDWINRGLRYARALLACANAADEEALARELPDLDAAFRIHAGADKLERGVLEARLLAGQTIEQAAAACGLAPEAVRAYEALFFHVLGKLHARMYILIQAVGGDLWGGGLTEDDVDVLLKLYGFLKGPFFLEGLIRYFRGGWSVPEKLEDASVEQLQELMHMLQLRALIQARVLPFPECLRAERLWLLTMELQRYIDSRSGNPLTAPLHVNSEEALTDELLSPPGSDPEAWWLARAAAQWRSAWAEWERRAV